VQNQTTHGPVLTGHARTGGPPRRIRSTSPHQPSRQQHLGAGEINPPGSGDTSAAAPTRGSGPGDRGSFGPITASGGGAMVADCVLARQAPIGQGSHTSPQAVAPTGGWACGRPGSSRHAMAVRGPRPYEQAGVGAAVRNQAPPGAAAAGEGKPRSAGSKTTRLVAQPADQGGGPAARVGGDGAPNWTTSTRT